MSRTTRTRGIPAAAWFYSQSFHTFLAAPTTSARLDAMLADNARVDKDAEAARIVVDVPPAKEAA
jgi:hypothetical protein